MGRPFAESTILAAAGAWENAAGLVDRRPPIAAA
jgi:hypothetical protein